MTFVMCALQISKLAEYQEIYKNNTILKQYYFFTYKDKIIEQ